MAEPQPPKLLDQARQKPGAKHYSIRTGEACVAWIRRFILFHDKRHPREMGEKEISAFPTHLPVQGKVAASTQNQALRALLFLYGEILEQDLDKFQNVVWAKKPVKLPIVFTRREVRAVPARMDGTCRHMASLPYCSGPRLMERLRLRVKDADFAYGQLIVRDGKGEKDRATVLPESPVEPLERRLAEVKVIHDQDLKEGFGNVYLPYALERKDPNAGREWGWRYVFPAPNRSKDPRSSEIRRHDASESMLQKAVKTAIRTAGIIKPGSPHSPRHGFATHLLEGGYGIRTVQDLLGREDVSTMIYTHVLNKGGMGVQSPADRL
jgi:integron integrase